MIVTDEFKMIIIISLCLFAGFIIGMWWEHRLQAEFVFDKIYNLVGS